MNQPMRLSFLTGLLTIALYYSGIFVFLTPLPFVYFLLKKNFSDFLYPAVVTFSITLFVYLVGLEFLVKIYEAKPALVWLFPVPAMGFLDLFPLWLVKVYGVFYFAFYLVVSAVVAYALKRAKKIYPFLAKSVLGIFLAWVVLFSLIWIFSANHFDLVESYKNYMQTGVEQVISLQENSSGDLEELVYIKSHKDEIVSYTLYLFPAFVLISISFLVALNLILAKRMFSAFFPFLEMFSLTTYRVPFDLVWFVIGVVSVLLLNYKVIKIDGLHYLCLNLVLLFAVVYFFQGFAIFISFLDKKRIFGFFRVALYFLLFLFAQFALLFFVSLGFFDSWMDVRKMDVATKQGS